MTEERKIELGLRVKAIGKELEEIAKEWTLENGLVRAAIEVSGQYDTTFEGREPDTVVHLFENSSNVEPRRMVAISSYLNDKVEDVFTTDRNDIVEKEDK